ncbi:MAG: hypothetical protein Q4F65_13385 [Propionibacteriaceae bacterium]|nr:hypothetical protein [Propionibacteriaceae bacterium]
MSTLTTELATGHPSADAQRATARGAQLPSGQCPPAAQSALAGGAQTSRDRTFCDTHLDHVAAQTTPQASSGSTPVCASPAGADLPTDQAAGDTQRPTVGGDQTDDRGRADSDTHVCLAPVVTDQPSGQCAPATQASLAGGSEQGQPAIVLSSPDRAALADPTLALAADILDDLERVKIANQNRLRSLTRDVEDSDGEMRGFGLAPDHPDVARLAALVQMLERAEHDAVLNLQRAMRRHPLGPWVKAQRGVGEKQAARLLATIGDPCINGSTGEYRTVSQLWAYSGLHVLPAGHRALDAQASDAGGGSTSGGDPGHMRSDTHSAHAGVAARRTKGQRANWPTTAKTRAWLIVEACMKQIDADCKTDTGIGDHHDDCGCSPYRVAVDNRRRHTATTHPEWTPGHSLNDGMRIASKRLLRDLWREARRLHGFPQEDPR